MASELTMSRRQLFWGGVAFVACNLGPPLLRSDTVTPCEGGIIIPNGDVAKNLLKSKMNPLLDQNDLVEDFRRRFHAKFYVRKGFIKYAIDKQIDNTVEIYQKNNPGRSFTVDVLMDQYKRRISHRFHEWVGENYGEFLKQTTGLAIQERDQLFEKEFGAIEGLVARGDSYERQHGCRALEVLIGCIKSDDAGNPLFENGRPMFNADWWKVSEWDRRQIPIEQMIARLGISPSPFLITDRDLRAFGISPEIHPGRAPAAARLNRAPSVPQARAG